MFVIPNAFEGNNILSTTKLLISLRKITSIRTEDFVVNWSKRKNLTPFIILISIVLSQNTSDKNALVALKKLLDKKIVEPQDIASLSLEELEEIIRPAGMYKIRAKTIKNIASFFKDNDELEKICFHETSQARNILMSIQGIGVKTAEVFLAAYCKKSVFPVDRHILRITSRMLGEKVSYTSASEYWKNIFSPNEYHEAHLRLIDLGRKICRTQKPLCKKCPLKDYCEYYKKHKKAG